MERLTKKKLGSSYPLKNDASAKVGLFTDYDGFFAFFEAVNRLGENYCPNCGAKMDAEQEE